MQTVKLICITFLSAVILAAVAVFPSRLCFNAGDCYIFYCGNTSSDCKEIRVTENAALKRITLSEVCGEATEYPSFDLEKFLKKTNGKVVFVEELSDSVNYYCTAPLPYSVKLRGEVINLHICVRGESAKVASPIIFGGY